MPLWPLLRLCTSNPLLCAIVVLMAVCRPSGVGAAAGVAATVQCWGCCPAVESPSKGEDAAQWLCCCRLVFQPLCLRHGLGPARDCHDLYGQPPPTQVTHPRLPLPVLRGVCCRWTRCLQLCKLGGHAPAHIHPPESGLWDRLVGLDGMDWQGLMGWTGKAWLDRLARLRGIDWPGLVG